MRAGPRDLEGSAITDRRSKVHRKRISKTVLRLGSFKLRRRGANAVAATGRKALGRSKVACGLWWAAMGSDGEVTKGRHSFSSRPATASSKKRSLETQCQDAQDALGSDGWLIERSDREVSKQQ